MIFLEEINFEDKKILFQLNEETNQLVNLNEEFQFNEKIKKFKELISDIKEKLNNKKDKVTKVSNNFLGFNMNKTTKIKRRSHPKYFKTVMKMAYALVAELPRDFSNDFANLLQGKIDSLYNKYKKNGATDYIKISINELTKEVIDENYNELMECINFLDIVVNKLKNVTYENSEVSHAKLKLTGIFKMAEIIYSMANHYLTDCLEALNFVK